MVTAADLGIGPFTWDPPSSLVTGETRQRCLAALRTADSRDTFTGLLAFARSWTFPAPVDVSRSAGCG